MLKDQIISLFYLFPILESGGYFIVEELDFPEKREDMRIGQEFPDLKSILKNILKKQDFNSKYIDQNLKNYFLDNVETIEIFRGNINEIAIIKLIIIQFKLERWLSGLKRTLGKCVYC